MARDFIAKFRQGHGLENSAKKKAYAEEITADLKRRISQMGIDLAHPNGDRTVRRVIGRWGSHFIFRHAEECNVGDVFPFAKNFDPDSVEWLEFRGGLHIHPRRFQKVSCEMIDEANCDNPNGKVISTCYYWQRVS